MSNLFSLFCCMLVTIWALLSPANAVEPHWITLRPAGENIAGNGFKKDAGKKVLFSKSFSLTQPPTRAVLHFVGEFTHAEISFKNNFDDSLNGSLVARTEPFDPVVRIDVTDQIRTGNQKLTVACEPIADTKASAFFAYLEMVFPNNSLRTIATDETWICDRGDVISKGRVDSRYLISAARRVRVNATDNYDQWKQAKGKQDGANATSFETYPGYEIQLIRTAASDEGSWVSMAFDPQGRVIIAKEKKGLLRMLLSDDGAAIAKTELIEDTLLECRGLTFAGDVLFANANNSKALYRMRPDTKSDSFATPEKLYSSEGGVGHGRNDLAFGPDGKIYSIHGDSVRLPSESTDWTSPHREARNGKPASEGHLLRIDPETGSTEILAAGLRNPFGIDFNSRGDVFTYDADAEFDMGAPWYRPTRVSHIVTGGDYGWRGVTRSWPPYFPDHADNARPNLDIGKGSPTAVKFGTTSNFPKRFREALFILDWTYGRIIAVHTFPTGASYRMTGETFLQGRPLNVTDLGFSPSGDMYLVTGGRKTQSALYRVRYVGGADETIQPKNEQQAAREKIANQSRQKRLQLESALGLPPSESMVELAWSEIDNPDPWIQHAARNLLERQSTTWMDRMWGETNLDRSVQSMLACARSLRHRNPQHMPFKLLEKINELDLETASRSQKLAALHCCWLCFDSSLVAVPKFAQVIDKKLDSLYPDDSFEVNRVLSELLVRSDNANVVRKTIGLLNLAQDPAERMQYLYVLRNTKQGWTDALRRNYFTALSSTDDFVGGEGMKGFLKKIREEAIASLPEDQLKSFSELLEKPKQVPMVAESVHRQFVQQWTVAAVLDAADKTTARDLVRGKRIFADAQCVNCHRCVGHGNFVGPDLTSIGRRFNQRDVLTSIIQPSNVVAEKYRSLQVVTTDGTSHLGQVVQGGDYRRTGLRLALDPTDPLKTIEIEKSDIQTQRYSKVSWMPEGLLNTFTRDEILDLLAYLNSPDQ